MRRLPETRQRWLHARPSARDADDPIEEAAREAKRTTSATAYLVAVIQLTPTVDVHFGIFSEPCPTSTGNVVMATVMEADGETFSAARLDLLSRLRQEMAGRRGKAIRERLIRASQRDLAFLDGDPR